MNWIEIKRLTGRIHLFLNLDKLNTLEANDYGKGIELQIGMEGHETQSEYVSKEEWERLRAALKLP